MYCFTTDYFYDISFYLLYYVSRSYISHKNDKSRYMYILPHEYRGLLHT